MNERMQHFLEIHDGGIKLEMGRRSCPCSSGRVAICIYGGSKFQGANWNEEIMEIHCRHDIFRASGLLLSVHIMFICCFCCFFLSPQTSAFLFCWSECSSSCHAASFYICKLLSWCPPTLAVWSQSAFLYIFLWHLCAGGSFFGMGICFCNKWSSSTRCFVTFVTHLCFLMTCNYLW